MAGPVNFLKDLVGASPSHSSDKVKSEQVGRYNHRTAKAVEGEPILKNSKEAFIAKAEKLEKQAGKFRSKIAKEVTLGKAHDMRARAESAKPNAQLHAEERLEDSIAAERMRKKQTGAPDQAKSKQVEQDDHLTDAKGRPILEGSREYLLAQAIRLEKEAASCVTRLEHDVKINQAYSLKIDANSAKSNAKLHAEKESEEAKNRMAERRIKKQRNPLDQVKKAAGKVADAIKHEVAELRNDGVKKLDDWGRKVTLVEEKEVLDLLIKKKETLDWHKSPVQNFNLWLDIRTQTAKVDKFKNKT